MDTKLRKAELMRQCELAMIRGETTAAVERIARDNNLTERTVWEYMRQVRQRWREEEQELRPERREHFRQMIMETFRTAQDSGNAMAMAAALKVAARLDGLEEPQRVEVTAQVDVLAMTPAQRQAEIDRLLRQRAQALDGTLVQGPIGDLLPPGPLVNVKATPKRGAGRKAAKAPPAKPKRRKKAQEH